MKDDEIYFVNASDGFGIYRICIDGSGMKKLCESGRQIQVSAEYVYFCAKYDAKYDISGLMTEEPPEYEDGFLYRMKKDGSDRMLISKNVRRFVLSDGYNRNADDAKIMYCCKYNRDGTMTVSRMGLDGQDEKEIWNIDFEGIIMLYEGSIYCCDIYLDSKKISRYQLSV